MTENQGYRLNRIHFRKFLGNQPKAEAIFTDAPLA